MKRDRNGLCHRGWKEEEDIKRYLLNINSKKIYDLENIDGRFKNQLYKGRKHAVF